MMKILVMMLKNICMKRYTYDITHAFTYCFLVVDGIVL